MGYPVLLPRAQAQHGQIRTDCADSGQAAYLGRYHVGHTSTRKSVVQVLPAYRSQSELPAE